MFIKLYNFTYQIKIPYLESLNSPNFKRHPHKKLRNQIMFSLHYCLGITYFL